MTKSEEIIEGLHEDTTKHISGDQTAQQLLQSFKTMGLGDKKDLGRYKWFHIVTNLYLQRMLNKS